jgi:SNF2 family DNA or RNA helicase
MSNRLKDIVASLLFGGQAVDSTGDALSVQIDSHGLIYFSSHEAVGGLKKGKGGATALMQTVVLQMLCEQGDAEEIPNGYRIDSAVVAALDDDQSNLLQLTGRVPYSFVLNINGHAKLSSFKVLMFVIVDGQERPFQRKGPFVSLGTKLSYRLTPPELLAIEAIEHHQQLPPEAMGETENLRLMALLQTAKRSGMNLDLRSFSNLDVVVPKNIGVIATRLPDGSLELCPSLGDGSTPDQLEKRWSQLDVNKDQGVLRINNRIVLMDDQKMTAIREVLGNKRIPANKVEEFIKTPSAFLDASIVNLDLGFSLRVSGVGKLQHMDFGTLDSIKRDWFATDSKSSPPEVLQSHIFCTEELDAFKQKLKIAIDQGAESVEYQDQQIDVSDLDRVEQILDAIEKSFTRLSDRESIPDASAPKKEKVTVLLKDAGEISQTLLEKSRGAFVHQEAGYSNVLRTPYPHQKDGIDWMLNLLSKSLKDDHGDLYRLQGALLADDMGLGKTFMALVVFGEYLEIVKKNGGTQKPVLVVAPLSLLENWEQEIQKTFKHHPFRDVKVLQSGRDLDEFRVRGSDRESVQVATMLDDNGVLDESNIRYALQLGSSAGTNRLDLDRRLVLTTYQTLRDYQFSLCVIDWGVVVFDEAQNIKNPNTLQTRAAKGLKADFKLLATGTPVENSLGDFWCLMDTAQPGLLGSWEHFRDKWITPITQASEEDRYQIQLEVGASLRDAVGSFMLRRIKEDQLPGLPQKYIRSAFAPTNGQNPNLQRVPELAAVMKGVQLQAYDAILDQYRIMKHSTDIPGHALIALNQLRKVSLHPRLTDNSIYSVDNSDAARRVIAESAKLKIMLDQLDHIRTCGEKVILFLITKQLQRALKIWLEKVYGFDIHIVNGDTAAVQKRSDVQTRKKLIEQFESVKGFNIIIMSPVAAGVGLTVIGANHVIHVERHWNPAKEAQATDRVYRIGQEKNVFIHLPAAIHPQYSSFDENLDKLLSGKLIIKDAVVTPEVVEESEMIKSMGL